MSENDALLKGLKGTDDILINHKYEQRYVARNIYGGIEQIVPVRVLESMLVDFEENWILALGCWELCRSEDGAILARIAPQCRFDKEDTLWHSWELTFNLEENY